MGKNKTHYSVSRHYLMVESINDTDLTKISFKLPAVEFTLGNSFWKEFNKRMKEATRGRFQVKGMFTVAFCKKNNKGVKFEYRAIYGWIRGKRVPVYIDIVTNHHFKTSKKFNEFCETALLELEKKLMNIETVDVISLFRGKKIIITSARI